VLARVHPLAEGLARELQLRERRPLARERERADEHIRGLAPGSLVQLEPVPLDLLARLVRDHGGETMCAGAASLAARPQRQEAQLAHEGHIGAVKPQLDELSEQHAAVDVHVLGEARRQVLRIRLEAAWRRALGGLLALQVLEHGLAVAAGVSCDRRDRPAAARERMDLHIVLLSQHPLGASFESRA